MLFIYTLATVILIYTLTNAVSLYTLPRVVFTYANDLPGHAKRDDTLANVVRTYVIAPAYHTEVKDTGVVHATL